MPVYDYNCLDCQKAFSVTESISRHGATKPNCPSCGGKKVEQVLSTFFAKTAKKS